MKKAFSLITPIVASTLVLTACSDYDNGYTEEKMEFIQNYKEVFGDLDQTQDWNAAQTAEVTVNTRAASEIKVYANTFGTYKLVGKFEGVSGVQDLKFDMVEGTEYIAVSNGSSTVFSTVGDQVNMNNTRTTYGATANELTTAGVSVASTYTDFDPAFMRKVYEVLPEEENNLGKVSQNFSYVSTGAFTIYPLYWNTSSRHEMGIYWKDDMGLYHTQLVYKDKEGNELAVKNGDGSYTLPDMSGNESASQWNNQTIGSKAITINLPVGTQFGFYLDVYTSEGYKHTVYSQSDLNTDCAQWTLDGKQAVGEWNGNNCAWTPVFGATFQSDIETANGTKTGQFLCFEDWNLWGPDLNDLVFVFTGENIPTVLDDDATSWVLSAEDLGGTFDIDYNDVVVAINHVSGQTTATVQALAAGGTLGSFIYFGDECLGEIHSFFGQGQNISGNYEPVNVNSTTSSTAGTVKTITVPADFSLAEYISKDAAETSSTMGGFCVKVVPQGELATQQNADASAQKIQNTVTKNDDNVPYVICTPQTWKRDNGDGTVTTGAYRWPLEKVAMFNFGDFAGAAYDYNEDYSFKSWVQGKNTATSKYWYTRPELSRTCAATEPLTVTGSGTGAAGSTTNQTNRLTSTLTAQYNANVTTGVKQEIIVKSKIGVTPTYVGPKQGATAQYNIENATLVALDKEGDYYRWKFNLVLNTSGDVTFVYTQPQTAVYQAGTLEITVGAHTERSFTTSANSQNPWSQLWQGSSATSQSIEVTTGQVVEIWWNNYANDGVAFQQNTFNAGGTGSTFAAMQGNNGFTFTAGNTAGTATIVISLPTSGVYSESRVAITIKVNAGNNGGGNGGGGNGALELPFTTGNDFTYTDKNGKVTNYKNTSFVDFSGVSASAGATAQLHVYFVETGINTYIDYNDGSQMLESYLYETVDVGKTINLTADQLAKAISTGGLHLVGQWEDWNNYNRSLTVTSATLTINSASAKKRVARK